MFRILPGREESDGLRNNARYYYDPALVFRAKARFEGWDKGIRSEAALARLSQRTRTFPVESKDPKTNLGTNNQPVQTGSTQRSERSAVTPEGSIPTSRDTRTSASRVPALFSDFPSIPSSGARGSVYDDVPPNVLVRGLKGFGIIITGRNGSRKQRNRPRSPETRSANNGERRRRRSRRHLCRGAASSGGRSAFWLLLRDKQTRPRMDGRERANPRSPISSRWILASENRSRLFLNPRRSSNIYLIPPARCLGTPGLFQGRRETPPRDPPPPQLISVTRRPVPVRLLTGANGSANWIYGYPIGAQGRSNVSTNPPGKTGIKSAIHSLNIY